MLVTDRVIFVVLAIDGSNAAVGSVIVTAAGAGVGVGPEPGSPRGRFQRLANLTKRSQFVRIEIEVHTTARVTIVSEIWRDTGRNLPCGVTLSAGATGRD